MYTAFDLLPSQIAVVQPDTRVVFANVALETALSLSRQTLTGMALAHFFADPATMQQAVRAASARQFAQLRLDAHVHRAGHPPLPVHVVIAPTDTAERVVVQWLPLESQTQHERDTWQASQTQAHTTLLRGLAHEIKNPLGGLRGAAQLLELDVPDPALRAYTQVIIREADRLQALVDRLLLPQRSAAPWGKVNIHEVLERVRTLVMAEFADGLHVQRDYDTSIPDLQGDRAQLIQAVLNLVRNAAQALAAQIARGEHGCITLRTRVARQITLGKHRHKLALALQVADNGPGIAPSLREHIFFPLVSGRAGGSGLGLTQAQTCVHHHHGAIACESTPGHTVFSVWIPLVQPA